MAIVACFLLLLSCSIAGQATPTSSLATQPAAHSPGIRDPHELDEMLVKRTSGSPSHRRSSPHLQGNGLQPVSPSPTPPTAPPAQHILVAADHLRRPDLSSATPLQVPADARPAPHAEPERSSRRSFNVNKRPRGSLTDKPALQAEAKREYRVKMMESIKNGERINKTKPGGGKYTITTLDEYQASRTATNKRTWSNLTPEGKAKNYERRNKRKREVRAKRRAQRKAQREGRSWEGSPVRKQGRPRRNWEQEQAGSQEGRQHVPSDTTMEKATQRVVDVPNASPITVWPRPPEPSSGSRPVPGSISRASHHPIVRASSPPPVDDFLSLSTPGSSKAWQKRPPRQVAPPAAGAREEKRLRLTLAPPGEHDKLQDRLQLTLAPPESE